MNYYEYIKNLISGRADDLNMKLTDEELQSAFKGVEFAVSECMMDSINDALSNVRYDRGEDNE